MDSGSGGIPGGIFNKIVSGGASAIKAISAAVSALSPANIVKHFGKITNNPVMSALLNWVKDKAASGVKSLLGFANGGAVPGARGQAQLAVVHGGEHVLSNSNLDAIGGAGSNAVDQLVALIATLNSQKGLLKAKGINALKTQLGRLGNALTGYFTTMISTIQSLADVVTKEKASFASKLQSEQFTVGSDGTVEAHTTSADQLQVANETVAELAQERSDLASEGAAITSAMKDVKGKKGKLLAAEAKLKAVIKSKKSSPAQKQRAKLALAQVREQLGLVISQEQQLQAQRDQVTSDTNQNTSDTYSAEQAQVQALVNSAADTNDLNARVAILKQAADRAHAIGDTSSEKSIRDSVFSAQKDAATIPQDKAISADDSRGNQAANRGDFAGQAGFLRDKGGQIQAKIDGLTNLLNDPTLNQDQRDELNQSLLDLTGALQDNTKAVFDANVAAATSAQSANVSTDDLKFQLASLLGDSQGQTSALADKGAQIDQEIANIQALIAQTSDPQQLQQLGDILLGLKISSKENTDALKGLTDTLNGKGLQDFSSSSWQQFRVAVFNGLGGLMPQYGIPAMATGGKILSDGWLYGHSGEGIVPARISRSVPGGHGDTNVNINIDQAGQEIDPVALASRLAFTMKHR